MVKWKKDKQGDWRLTDGKEYVGMICPHYKYLQVIVEGRLLTGSNLNRLKDNKKWLEEWWKTEQKINQYRNEL